MCIRDRSEAAAAIGGSITLVDSISKFNEFLDVSVDHLEGVLFALARSERIPEHASRDRSAFAEPILVKSAHHVRDNAGGVLSCLCLCGEGILLDMVDHISCDEEGIEWDG